MSNAGSYSIGSDHLPGLSKLVEELGECGQVAGKIMGRGGFGQHWDGSDLKARLEEEIADVQAAMVFFSHANDLDVDAICARIREKSETFGRWHEEQSK